MTAPDNGTFDFHALMHATAQNHTPDAFRPALRLEQWKVFGPYLQPQATRAGQILIKQKASDRAVYIIEEGTLSVQYEDKAGRIRMVNVEPGSAVGEGSFFSRQPRNATVQSATACRLWALTPVRFDELASRQPAMAVEVAMALGAIVSHRLANRQRRDAVT